MDCRALGFCKDGIPKFMETNEIDHVGKALHAAVKWVAKISKQCRKPII